MGIPLPFMPPAAGGLLAGKRWIAPPSWTPGGSTSFRQFVWQLSAWSHLTGMAHEGRGISVALSLGGRAARIAQAIPHHILAQRFGLYVLMQRLSHDLGQESQDRIRGAAKDFMDFRRPRSMSASESIAEFERRYEVATEHGLQVSRTLLATYLLEWANLNESQQHWCLQCIAGDMSRYAELRQSLRRLPGLQSRGDRQADGASWPVSLETNRLRTPLPELPAPSRASASSPASAASQSADWGEDDSGQWAAEEAGGEDSWWGEE